MTPWLSFHLDLLRFAAAILVLLSHLGYERLGGGSFAWVRDYNLGSDAVALFFVISGLVIAYAAAEKDRDLRSFAFARATRIYSVAIPAVLLTLLLDGIGVRLAPEAYAGWWYDPRPAAEKLAVALTFTNELWLAPVRIGSNGPYWSLAYEVWYYVLFGLAAFLRPPLGLVLAGHVALLVGPAVLLLLPVWLTGVLAWRLIARAPDLDRRTAWLCALVPPLAYVALRAAGLPALLLGLTAEVLGAGTVRHGLRFSDEFLWNALIGVLAALHLVGVWRLGRDRAPPASALAGPVRWLAGASFSIYLVHYPALQLGAAFLPPAMPAFLRSLLLLAGTLLLCLATAALFERRLGAIRRHLRQLRPPGLGMAASADAPAGGPSS